MDFAYARLLALPKDWQVEGRECVGLHRIYCLGRELFCLAAAIPALPVHHQWGLRLFPGIFLLLFITAFGLLLHSPHHQHLLFCETCSHQWLMSAPHLEITSLESVLTLLVV